MIATDNVDERESVASLWGQTAAALHPQECRATKAACPRLTLTRNRSAKRVAFTFQQLFLAFESPTITAEALVFAYNAMTRNHERDRIRRTCASDCTDRARFAERLRHVAVRNCLSIGDRAQHLPNLALKRCRSDVEW